MPKKYLLYIHDDRFQLEKNKSNLVNKLLEEHYRGIIPNVKTNEDGGVSIDSPKQPAIIKTPQQAASIVQTLPKPAVKYFECKNGHLSDEQGRCLQKGCKYA